MPINPRKYIEVDKRFPDSMAGDADRVLVVKNDESGYEHSAAVTVESLTGSIIMWPFDTPPPEHLICDGAEYDIATYPALGALFGENAPGSGKFNVPDISFVKNSKGQNTLTDEPDSVGEHSHVAELEAGHTHMGEASMVPNHHHTVSNQNPGRVERVSLGTGMQYDVAAAAANPDWTTSDAGAHDHRVTIDPAGAHTHLIRPHNVGGKTQPACTLINFCIRT